MNQRGALNGQCPNDERVHTLYLLRPPNDRKKKHEINGARGKKRPRDISQTFTKRPVWCGEKGGCKGVESH